MRLDRAEITAQAFSTAPDGYDREEVDRHLAAIADALDEQSPQVGESAGEQLRTIVEGAEQSATALRETAERESAELLESAVREAEATRAKATQESASQLGQAHAAVRGLLERVQSLQLGIEDARQQVERAGQEMARRLGEGAEPVIDTLRERAEALGAEIDLMGSGLANVAVEPAAAAGTPAGTVPEREAATPAPSDARTQTIMVSAPPSVPSVAPPAEPAPISGEPVADEPGTGLAGGDLDDAVHRLAGQEPGGEPEPPGSETEPGDGDTPGRSGQGSDRARLVALNMALSGTSRAETERHLREAFELEDAKEILDEVYSRADRAE